MPPGFYPRPSPETRFWNQVDKTNEYGCWTWTGYVDPKGYARILVHGHNQYIHRFSYVLHKGPIPDGFTIDHLCRTRHCINPAHLEAVTIKVNNNRGFGAWATRVRATTRTHCQRGHAFTQENSMILPDGIRRCRTCHRKRGRQWWALHGGKRNATTE